MFTRLASSLKDHPETYWRRAPQQLCPWTVSIPRPLDLEVIIVPMILTSSNYYSLCFSYADKSFLNAPFINKPSRNSHRLRCHLCSVWNFTGKAGKIIMLTWSMISDIFSFISTILLGFVIAFFLTFRFYKLGSPLFFSSLHVSLSFWKLGTWYSPDNPAILTWTVN